MLAIVYPFLLIPVIALALIVFWVYQFVQVMLLSDSDFPGRHDKALWVVAFICIFPLAPLAFFTWKIAYRAFLRGSEEANSQGG